jgi:hypothetical protein
MVQVTIGPPQTLDGPLPVAPEYNLLTVARIVDDPDEHWQVGASVNPYPTDTPLTHDPCSSGTFREKDEGTLPEVPTFGPFAAYLPVTCTARGVTPGDFERRAQLAFQALEHFAVEQEFSQGLANPLNPFLADGNATILGGGAVTSAVGLSYLEDAIGATGQAGLIHATPSVAAAWGGEEAMTDRGILRTTGNGTPVASGGGYIGATPEGSGAASAGQSWVYATGPVQVRRSEMYLDPPFLSEALDRELNIVTYRAERNYLVTWVPDTLQVAVLIDWSP